MSILTDSSTVYLNKMENINLYSPTNIYELNSSVANDIASILIGNVGSSAFVESLLARVLLPNTPIQQIANIELAQALALNFANNLSTTILPTVNSSGNIQFIKGNYWTIDVNNQTNTLSKLLSTILGSQPVTNPIPKIGNGFTSADSNNYLKTNRGQGQIDTYNQNLGLNDFSPDNSQSQYGQNNIDADAIASGIYGGSIEAITNNLINCGNTLVNGYPSTNGGIGNYLDPNALAYNDLTTGDLLSKGDGTYTDDSNTKFLRVFKKNASGFVSVSQDTQYDNTLSLMKFNHGTAGPNSVLQTVFPNISPRQGDTSVKNLMFSIENLANIGTNQWKLKPYELGENNGRIMWFPPYNLAITENVNSDWETVKFVGRTEPIYTYNGSERSVNLSFTLIVDYPADFNKNSWLTASDNDFAKFFRQNNSLTRIMSPIDVAQTQVAVQQQVPVAKQQPLNTNTSPFEKGQALVTHFDNNVYQYELTLTQDVNGTGQKDNNDFANRINSLVQFLNGTNGNLYQIFIEGHASKLDTDSYNLNLSYFRTLSVYNMIVSQLTDKSMLLQKYPYSTPSSSNKIPTGAQSVNQRFSLKAFGDTGASATSSSLNAIDAAVTDRYVKLYITYNPNLDTTIKTAPEDSTTKTNRINTSQAQNQTSATNSLQGGEEVYFNQLKNDQDKLLILEKYKDRLKYFTPVFHSQTPEDFNTRLTFLQQCMKQGGGLTTDLPNSIFGTPPVCILRLGDFFHTKIIINSLNYNFDPLIWDTNPEGIGMQPMLCNVTLDCKIIGGQSLQSPLTTLQNALNYNFYANTEVYDSRASTNDSSHNTSVVQPTTNNQVQKTNSQTARQNGAAGGTQTTAGSSAASSNSGGTISYNNQFTTIIGYFTDWSNTLLTVNSNLNYNSYINGDTININQYNSDNKTNSNTTAYILINNYYSKINNDKTGYNNLLSTLTSISSTGIDGSKSITNDSNFTNFNTMISMVQSFHDTILTNIAGTTQANISIQLTTLIKYNTNTLQSLNYTS